MIEVYYDTFELINYDNLEEAREDIENRHVNNVCVNSIREIDENGKVIAEYGLSWKLTIEKLN